MSNDELRKIPAVDKVLTEVEFPDNFPHPLRKQMVSETLNEVRESVKNGHAYPGDDEVYKQTRQRAFALDNNRIRPVLNATGVVLHTNLGRAPYAGGSVANLTEVVQGYSSLEIDVSSGERGGRGKFGEELLSELTGAEAAGFVNNCSGALVLALKTLTEGKDVLISRGELVQIGGGFRVPEVLEASGSTLREVGTTNKTSIDDYRQELDSEVGMILRVHRSNFEQVGFTGSPSSTDLAELADDAGIPFVSDLGSGALWSTEKAGLKHESQPDEMLESGADLVTFSGDKLVGGPQAGIFLGGSEHVEAMKEHPFFRALRCGKMTLTTLESTLMAYAKEDEDSLPTVRQLSESLDEQKKRARSALERLRYSDSVSVETMEGTVGGGSLPTESIESAGFVIDTDDPETLLADLRRLDPPVIGRIRDGKVTLNFRTILPGQERDLVDGLDELFSELYGS
jgi:L-seryl-tRNA(Ser) seleniumtransferase